MILPNVNLERKCNVFGDPSNTEEILFRKDGKVTFLSKIIIEKGELLTGMLDKGTVGNTAGGVVHTIWLDAGNFLFYIKTSLLIFNSKFIPLLGFYFLCLDSIIIFYG